MKPENLIDIDKSILKPGQRFIKIADGVFLPVGVGGSIPGGGTGIEPRFGVAVDDGQGNIKFQPLSFTGTTPADSGASEDFTGYSYNTGKKEPLFPGGGGGGGGVSAEYYKCTKVDTTTQTWAGNKAVLTEGIYTFETTETTGLTYTKIIPAVGTIYSSDALVKVATLWVGSTIPKEGLIFEFLADSKATTATTGQTLVYEMGDITEQSFNGIPCLHFAGNARMKTAENSGIQGTASRSLSFWAYPDKDNTQTYCNAFGLGSQQRYMFNCGVMTSGSYINAEFTTWGNDFNQKATVRDSKWHHFCYIFDTNTPDILNIYVDGKSGLVHDVSGIDTGNQSIYIGGSGAGGWYYKGLLSKLRLYNRILTTEEINGLASEIVE